MLEARDVPAVLYWNPPSQNDLFASTASNWREGGPLGPVWTAAPSITDDLFFNTGPSSVPGGDGEGSMGGGSSGGYNSNCIFTSTGGGQFGSIHILSLYTGTITFERDITVGGFSQASGNIDQTAPSQTSALTFTVDVAYANYGAHGGAFSWTGGVLNSGSNAGVVNIVGMTNATIGDGTDSSYTTGSDIKLLSGTTMIASGRIELANEAGVVVDTGCVLQALEDPVPPPPPTSPQPPPAEQQPKAYLLALNKKPRGPGLNTVDGLGNVLLAKGEVVSLASSDVPVWVFGGELHVVNRSLEVRGVFKMDEEGNAIPEAQLSNSKSILVTGGGKVVVEEGYKLTVAGGGLLLRSGLLTTKVNGDVANHMAKIVGKLRVDSAPNLASSAVVQIATIGRPATGVFVPTLHIEGDVSFIKGVFKTTIYTAGGSFHDRWTCSGKFDTWGAAVIDPTLVRGNESDPATVLQGMTWDVIISMGGYATEGGVPPAGALLPTTTAPAAWGVVPIDSYPAPGGTVTYPSFSIRKLNA